ncbi:MAG: hypothetical protein QOE77_3590 [Blastocatellia bacterium]|jgi:hypothetical protein|nr:hypothetical protein [Blastocatellia bacterium]
MTLKSNLTSEASGRLARLLIAKSIAETLLVGTIAVVFFLTLFPPYFRGWGEATPKGIAGWAVNQSEPWERVQVQLFIDGQLAGSSVASGSRPDVRAAGWAVDEWHGYEFQTAGLVPGEHLAQVYALHSNGAGNRRTLQLLGDPIRFVVAADGGFHEVR